MNSQRSYLKETPKVERPAPSRHSCLQDTSFGSWITTTDSMCSSNSSSEKGPISWRTSSSEPSGTSEKQRQPEASSTVPHELSWMGSRCLIDGNTVTLTLEFQEHGGPIQSLSLTHSHSCRMPLTTSESPWSLVAEMVSMMQEQ